MDMMQLVYTVFFFGIGLCFGSFALATAWRIKKNKDFVKDTSECEHCHHKLAAIDLIPLVSWLSLGGKCRYCRKKISGLLPLAELVGAVTFAASYAYWPYGFASALPLLLFIVWCVALILLLILFFYDLQWYILPNKVIYPLWAVASVFALLTFVATPTLATVFNVLMAVTVGAGLFWLFYTMSKGAWIGYGDVRLGVAIGLLAGTPAKAAITLFTASIAGIVLTLPSVVTKKRTMTSKLPFGPLLILGLFVAVIWGQSLIDWYVQSVLLIP